MTSCTQVAHCEPWDFFPHMANCEPLILVPSVTLLRCHVASPHLAMCHPTPHTSKNVKSRPSRNPTKFDVVAKFLLDDFNGKVHFVIQDLEKFRIFIKITILPFLRKLDFLGVSHNPCILSLTHRITSIFH